MTSKYPRKKADFSEFLYDLRNMPKTMRQLGVVQFFSWFALFSMWVFTSAAIATHVYHTAPGDTTSAQFNEAGNWVGIMFAVYNVVSAVYALSLPAIVKRITVNAPMHSH